MLSNLDSTNISWRRLHRVLLLLVGDTITAWLLGFTPVYTITPVAYAVQSLIWRAGATFTETYFGSSFSNDCDVIILWLCVSENLCISSYRWALLIKSGQLVDHM